MISIIFAGVDIGSTTTKCVLIDAEGKQLTFKIMFTTFNRNESGEMILEEALKEVGMTYADVAYLVTTGYGRKAFQKTNLDIPEIIAHAIGTEKVMPGTRTIIDIGGQDSKVIELGEDGNVVRFEMNDKCAAGTGRFFEILTQRLLGIEMDELSDLISNATAPPTISSMCTIFAETEIISLLSQGIQREDIVAGVSKSIIRRIVGMGKAGQMTFKEPIVFSGGVAKNAAIVNQFSEYLSKPVTAVALPQSTAALGAALTAKRMYEKEN